MNGAADKRCTIITYHKGYSKHRGWSALVSKILKNYSGFNFSSSPYLLRKVALENTYYKKIGKKSRKEVSKRSDST